MKTVVLQTFRREDVPEPIARCLASVSAWAAAQGYAYEFCGDEIVSRCGAPYLAAADGNMRTITNLARLEWVRASLAEGYERAIWLDADVFIFGPARFSLDVREGYAFGKEAWIDVEAGTTTVKHGVHNAALVFAGHHPDLDRIIDLIRHIAATRRLESNFQVGVNLLTGLHAGLRFPLLTNVGMIGPAIVSALARGSHGLPCLLAREHGYPMHAANIALSLHGETSPHTVVRAMDILEDSKGEVINRHLWTGGTAPLLVPDYGSNTRPLHRASALRRAAGIMLPPRLKAGLRGLFSR